jgi:hypothetical protein
MTERLTDHSDLFGETEEYLRVYFREDPDPEVTKDIDGLIEILELREIAVFEVENARGMNYVIEFPASKLGDLLDTIEGKGCWITMPMPWQIDPETELPLTLIEEYKPQGPDTLILKAHRRK